MYEVYKTPIEHYVKNFERACKFIKKELINKIVEQEEGHLKFQIFDIISKKGGALFKHTLNKLQSTFAKLEAEEQTRVDIDKVKTKLKRELDNKLRIFKEFIDMEENKKVFQIKQQ